MYAGDLAAAYLLAAYFMKVYTMQQPTSPPPHQRHLRLEASYLRAVPGQLRDGDKSEWGVFSVDVKFA